MFGTNGQFVDASHQSLSQPDQESINELAGTSGAINTRAADIRPSLDIELKGKTKPMASTLTFKFIAIKTLDVADMPSVFPSRVFFTQKFYNFKESKTEPGLLRLPLSVAKNL